MLEKLSGNDDSSRSDRDALIRERMQAQGVSEEEARRLVLSEEELRVGRRDVAAGEAMIGKHVETEHVQESVPLRREEAVIERRPITGGMHAADATIGRDEEIRIPLHAEEAVVEKRVVPKEELVVRKREVVENETVEADLRRERADVRTEGDVHREDMRGSGRHEEPMDR